MVLAIIQMQQVILKCAFNTKGYLYNYLSTHPKDIRSRLIKDQTDAKEYEAAAGYYPAKYPGQNANIYVNNPKDYSSF